MSEYSPTESCSRSSATVARAESSTGSGPDTEATIEGPSSSTDLEFEKEVEAGQFGTLYADA